jgi:NADH-quinone oxidoreductase subunit N
MAISAIFPMMVVALGALCILILSVFRGYGVHTLMRLSIAFLSVAFISEVGSFASHPPHFLMENILGKVFVIDDFSILFDLMFLLGAIVTLTINGNYLDRRRYFNAEFFALFLFSVFGMMAMVHSNDLVTAFISLEITSVTLYALVGYHKNHTVSAEAMMKYMILGAFAGVLFMLGTVIVYGVTGSTSIPEIALYASKVDGFEPALATGALFLAVTILFKIGAVPFHAWVSDVYQGSPFPVTMHMASTFKVAVFALAIRMGGLFFSDTVFADGVLLTPVVVMTLVGGSLLALSQDILKRVLAASSIVHGGYMLIAFSCIGFESSLASSAIMFYLLSYFISSAGAFGILSYLSLNAGKSLRYEDFRGLAYSRPWLAAMMAIFMFSLSGFPATIGFLGKFYIFTSAIEAHRFVLAGVGIATAFVSVYYYFRLIAEMYFYEASGDTGFGAPEFDTSILFIAFMALMAVWGGVGTGLIPMVPGADGLIEMAKLAMESISL